MRYSGETNYTEHGLRLLTWDKCGIFKDNGELLDGVAEANLRMKAGGLAVLEVKVYSSKPINRDLPECPFPQRAIIRKEQIGDGNSPRTEVDVYEFAVLSFNVETKEELAFLESHV